MASILRQIVAGPRTQHPEAGLDLCYVTPRIIATSGPSQTYPKRAYRNPLDRLVGFLDDKHGDNWAIWEFRAEGTGYPDKAVYHRIRHYPWPDHHPPPFRLVPMIVAGMRNWLDGEELEGGRKRAVNDEALAAEKKREYGSAGPEEETERETEVAGRDQRVVVVHCKAGKGRSGTSAVSYLVAEEGWTAEDALARFTQRRMRRGFGAGVSIPSQLRTVGYVDRWANAWKRADPESAAGADPETVRRNRHYVDRPVEIVEVHAWGLRNGVKLEIGGFADEGKRIEVRHAFAKAERIIVLGDAPGGGGVADMVYDMAGYGAVDADQAASDVSVEVAESTSDKDKEGDIDSASRNLTGKIKPSIRRKTTLIKHPTKPPLKRMTEPAPAAPQPSQPAQPPPTSALNSRADTSASSTTSSSPSSWANNTSDVVEPGGRAVIFKPSTPIVVPNSDVLVRLSRRHRGPRAVAGLAMVTATAHVWFNVFFEGDGPELMAAGKAPEQSGVFEIGWDALDGLKGSSRRGTRAVDRIAVVWRVVGEGIDEKEPDEGEAVPQMRPANWRGESEGEEGKGKGKGKGKMVVEEQEQEDAEPQEGEGDDGDLEGVKSSGLGGEGGVDK